jgi:hypothetical protein
MRRIVSFWLDKFEFSPIVYIPQAPRNLAVFDLIDPDKQLPRVALEDKIGGRKSLDLPMDALAFTAQNPLKYLARF